MPRRVVEVAPARLDGWLERFHANNPEGPQRIVGQERFDHDPLAILLVRRGGYAVGVATGGLWAASLFADFVAHLGVYGTRPHRRDLGKMLQASGQILQAAVLPAALLAAAGFGVLETYTAMWVAMWALVAELGLIALFAVRKTQLRWWEKLLTVLVLASFGAVVLVIKMLAH